MPDNETGSELEVKTGTVVDHPPVNDGQTPVRASDLDQYLRDTHAAEVDPDEGAYSRIIEQVLKSTSPDIVLTPTEAVDAKDMVGIPLVITGFDLNESEYDQGSPF